MFSLPEILTSPVHLLKAWNLTLRPGCDVNELLNMVFGLLTLTKHQGDYSCLSVHACMHAC